MQSPNRIDAPQRVIDAMKRAQEAMERIQLEAQAIQFGAMAALDVPEGWLWDGSGWVAPTANNTQADA